MKGKSLKPEIEDLCKLYGIAYTPVFIDALETYIRNKQLSALAMYNQIKKGK